MANLIEVKVPDIGDFKGVEIIEVMVSVGDSVSAEQSLITLESDKAAMEIPCPEAGVIKELKISVGDKVSEGDLILMLETSGAAASPAPAQASTPAAPVAAPAAATSGGSINVTVPDIGDFKGVEIIELMVSVGDEVSAEQSLITLESDKAAMEIPCPQAGKIKEIKVSLGDKVSEGDLILVLETSGGAAAVPAAAAPETPAPPPSAAPVAPSSAPFLPDMEKPPAPRQPVAAPGKKPHASPSVRRFARELGVNLGEVGGSGPKGRIRKEDVKAYVKGEMSKPRGAAAAPASGGGFELPPMPEIDFSQFGEIEEIDFPRIKKISGPALHRSWLHVPHVTQFDEADITGLEEFRKSLKGEAEKRGVKVTPLAFMVKAVVAALKRFPNFNASLRPDKSGLILKKYYHIGFAADTPNGLVVPVIKDADQKGLFDLAEDLGMLSAKARDGKLGPKDMQGGTFTISSLGGIGGTAFTPIVNAPEVAILGVSRSSMKPVYENGAFVPRLIVPLSLSYDHRVIDGAEAARFSSYLSFILSDVRNLLL